MEKTKRKKAEELAIEKAKEAIGLVHKINEDFTGSIIIRLDFSSGNIRRTSKSIEMS